MANSSREKSGSRDNPNLKKKQPDGNQQPAQITHTKSSEQQPTTLLHHKKGNTDRAKDTLPTVQVSLNTWSSLVIPKSFAYVVAPY
jgi:hypothetical protein